VEVVPVVKTEPTASVSTLATALTPFMVVTVLKIVKPIAPLMEPPANNRVTILGIVLVPLDPPLPRTTNAHPQPSMGLWLDCMDCLEQL
jgi:hypothetical protein